jgi:hypothetical protein
LRLLGIPPKLITTFIWTNHKEPIVIRKSYPRRKSRINRRLLRELRQTQLLCSRCLAARKSCDVTVGMKTLLGTLREYSNPYKRWILVLCDYFRTVLTFRSSCGCNKIIHNFRKLSYWDIPWGQDIRNMTSWRVLDSMWGKHDSIIDVSSEFKSYSVQL